jgi:hypothetical protein
MCFGETNLGHYGGKNSFTHEKWCWERVRSMYLGCQAGRLFRNATWRQTSSPLLDAAATDGGRLLVREEAKPRRNNASESARAPDVSRWRRKRRERGSVEKRRVGSTEKHSGGRVSAYYISPVRYNSRFLLEIANVPESSFVRRRCFRSWRVSAR